MNGLVFGSDGYVHLPTKYHGDVNFSKWKWDLVCSQSERYWYKFNEEKVSTTLIVPDYCQHHKTINGQFIYYKAYGQYKLAENVILSSSKDSAFFAVVIDVNEKKVCTVYPTDKPKPGKEYGGT